MSRFLLSASSAALLSLIASAAAADSTGERPNFLVIVADDLGFSDLGAFGGEIATPNLDSLANAGLKLTGFHTAPTCSPTRSMLMSGTDNHLAGLGSMAELLTPGQKGQPGYEGYLRPEVASLAERFRAGGYRTVMAGKWHLGLKQEQDPHARGFDHSFALLPGGANHFGADKAPYTEDGEKVARLPDGFFSSDTFTDKLIAELQESAAEKGAGTPFFAYLTYTAPHWPLQAHAEDIARYQGRYDAGFDALRDQRLARQAELGLIDPSFPAHSAETARGGWDSLSAAEQREGARDMEIYAAMVDRMDQNVGRVIDELQKTGQFDNTVILFLADNGAEGIDGARSAMLKGAVDAAANDFDNLGAASSYVTYGPGWAQAATAPSWRYKGYETEGGTRTVAFVTGPGVERKGVGTAYLSVADVAPTLLGLAGLPTDATFEGRQVEPIRGKPWGDYLAGRSDTVYSPDDTIGGELFGSRALRQGDWKLVDVGDGVWRLFDVASDPGETKDLSLARPEKAAALEEAWKAYASAVGVVMPDAEIVYRP